ncbi:MAG: collagen-like protein [Gemmatimonadota bacterium]|nr:collagen-like protein [Gemmatimonadota bacterium]MDH5757953.1 collagen-like protein [Gemmatimonadota bacterium]
MLRRSWAFLFIGALVIGAGCEGPEGPTGPAGPQGTQGLQGPAGPTGPAGQDANENCTQCHTEDVTLYAKQVQYGESKHRLGGNFERSTTSCAPCHTHQGFIERIATGAMVTAANVVDPAPINCRTCHQIHTTYTDADFALTTTAPVELWNAGHGTVDYGADVGNLCAQCHQGRVLSPVPELGGADVTLTSSRYGFHHGPQAQVVGGVGAFEFTGSRVIAGGPTVHGDPDSNPEVCGTCHMAQAFGSQAGGHTWKMSYLYHGAVEENVAGCNGTGCHTTVPLTTFDHNTVQTLVTTLLADISTELQRIGIQGVDHYAVPGTWPADVVAGFANWQMFEEDLSHGIHNPAYAMAVLTNTLEVMRTH